MKKTGVDDFIVTEHATAADLDKLPRVEVWPTLRSEALYGLAGRFVKAVDLYTEADPVALLTHFLTGVGNVIGARAHARVGHDHHPSRLFIGIVGRTSKSRKGVAWSEPRHLLASVALHWATARVKTGLSTGEGLIHNVQNAKTKLEAVREKGQLVGHEEVVVDEGEPDKRLLIIEPELAVVLKRMAGEGNTLSGVIREAWDSGNLSTLTKTDPLQATGAHVSIIGHISEEELRRYLTETERANGFANRILWLLVRRSKYLPEGPAVPDALIAPFVTELRQVVDFASEVDEITRDEEARALWADVYPKLSEGEPGMVGAIISRAEAQVLRLSVLYAVLDRSALIRPEHLKAALAVWDYAEASARRIFGGRLGAPVADTILHALRSQGPMPETAIWDLLGRHKTAMEIHEALDYLQRLGRIRSSSKTTGGRPAVIWEAI